MRRSGWELTESSNQTLEWLENAIRLGFINYPYFSRSRFLDGIREDERFQTVMADPEKQWEAFEV